MKATVATVSVLALFFDLLLVIQADVSLPCILLGVLLVPLAGILGAIHVGTSGHGWWSLVLVLVTILAVIAAFLSLGILLRCFDIYDGSCQRPSATEAMEAQIAIAASLFVPPVAALLATMLLARGASVSTATGAEGAQPMATDAIVRETEPPTGTY
jgi:hypothetical protein